MSRYRRVSVKGGCFFFTLVSYQRRTMLCDETFRIALRQAIEKVRITRPFVIDAWVLLPDHLHCIWTLPDGDADFSTRWMMIKRLVSIACHDDYHRPDLLSDSREKRRESNIWQRRFWEHQIRDEIDFARHFDYVHVNPLKHGLVQRVRDWPYSSFHRAVDRGIYPMNWCGDADLNLSGAE